MDVPIENLSYKATIIGVAIAILELLYEIITNHRKAKQQKIKATLTDFASIRKENEELTSRLVGLSEDEKRKIIKHYLSQMERFAVGLKNGEYRIETINEMSGQLLVTQYEDVMKGYISARRKELGEPKAAKLYVAYEKMMKQLYRKRKIPWKD